MAIYLALIIAGSVCLVFSLSFCFGLMIPSASDGIMGCLLCVAVVAFLVTACMPFLGFKKVPEDNIRIFSRSGAMFHSMTEGVHYIAELVPFNEYTINCRPRPSGFTPGTGNTMDSPAVPVQTLRDSSRPLEITPQFHYRLTCSRSSAASLHEAVRRQSGAGAATREDRVFHRIVAPAMTEAIQNCERTVLGQDRQVLSVAKIEQLWSSKKARDCIHEKAHAAQNIFRITEEDFRLSVSRVS